MASAAKKVSDPGKKEQAKEEEETPVGRKKNEGGSAYINPLYEYHHQVYRRPSRHYVTDPVTRPPGNIFNC